MGDINMKIKIIIKAILIFIITFLVSGFSQYRLQSIGRINFLLGDRGDIRVQHPGFNSWMNVRLYSSVFSDDHFKTKTESRCEIKLRDNSIVRIGENADFILKKDKSSEENICILNAGRIWANIKKLFKPFQIKTPTAVCAVRGTIYRVDADSSTKVLVYQGEVEVAPLWVAQGDTSQIKQKIPSQQLHEIPGPREVSGPFEVTLDQWIKIIAGFKIEIRPDGKFYKSKINEKEEQDNAWVRWNKSRDGRQ